MVNIDLDFSLGKSLGICVGYAPSKQDIISFMSAKGLMNTEIWEGTQLATLSYSLNLTQVYLLFKTPLSYQLQVDLLASIV